MKWLTLTILILLSISVYAEENIKKTYRPNQIINFGMHLSNQTGDIAGASCYTQIRDAAFGVVDESIMNEIGGGYYNYTYNTSQVGNYFCRQNCTQGEFYASNTCDFIVGGDDNMLLGALVFIPIFISILFLVLSWVLDEQKFWALKIGFAIAAFIPIFWAYNYATMLISKLYNFTDIIDNIGSSVMLYGFIFWAFVAIIIITILWDIIEYVMENKKKKTGNYE